MRPWEVDRMTPGELTANIEANIEQRTQNMKFKDLLNGVLCSLLANINRGSDTEPFKPSDFTVLRDAVIDDDNKGEEHPEMIEDKLKIMEAAGLMTHG